MLHKQCYSSIRGKLLSLPSNEMAKRFDSDANLFYPYKSKQIFSQKREFKTRSPMFFEINVISFDDSPVSLYISKITQFGAYGKKDLHISETFENLIDAYTWLLARALSVN